MFRRLVANPASAARTRTVGLLLIKHGIWSRQANATTLQAGLGWDDPTLGEAYSSFDYEVENVHLSLCYSCGGIAIWVHNVSCLPETPSGRSPARES